MIPKRLSEAIREGIPLARHGRGRFLSQTFQGELVACALGMAYLAIGGSREERRGEVIAKALRKAFPMHKACQGWWTVTVEVYVEHLNDRLELPPSEVARRLEEMGW